MRGKSYEDAGMMVMVMVRRMLLVKVMAMIKWYQVEVEGGGGLPLLTGPPKKTPAADLC